jgi:DNA-binding MarR family transcriptional regulator
LQLHSDARSLARLSLMYDGALVPAGLKSTQFSILSEIFYRRRDDPTTMSELAEAILYLKRAVSRRNKSLLQWENFQTFAGGPVCF